MTYIPVDIFLFHILPMLPITDQCRFRCVSKDWDSSIRRFLSPTPDHLIFVCDGPDSEPQVFSAPLLLGRVDVFRPPQATHIASFPNRRYSVVDAQCVNGLLCLHPKNSSHSEAFVHICNPTTRQIISLPDDPSIRNGFRASTHFGYDPVRNEFKVLRLLNYDGSDEFKISIFTIGDPTNSWRHLTAADLPTTTTCPYTWFREDKRGVCVNGAIHWRQSLYFEYILAFDLVSETFRKIEIPKGYIYGRVALPNLRFQDLVELNGCLTLVGYDGNNLNLTVLKDYGTQEWTPPIRLGSVIGANKPILGEKGKENRKMHFPLCRVPKTGEILLLPHFSMKLDLSMKPDNDRAKKIIMLVGAISYDIREQRPRDAVVAKVPGIVWPDWTSGYVNIFFYQENFRSLY